MLSPRVYTYLQEKKKEGLPPDFLWSLVALANFMRLSLLKAAHAVMSGAAYRKSGSPILFHSCTRKSANMGHPSRGQGWCAGELFVAQPTHDAYLRLGRQAGCSLGEVVTFLDCCTVNEGWVPHCPDFLWRLAALIDSMRLSLMKGAHPDLSSTAWQEIGVKPSFGLSGIP
jgi:hypothetical protein